MKIFQNGNFYQINEGSDEDRYIYMPSINISIYGVFDGHGGIDTVEYISKHFTKRFYEYLNAIHNSDTLEDDIKDYFKIIDIEVCNMLIDKKRDNGSTCALVVRIYNKLYIINLGDSKVILYKNKEKIFETIDHCYNLNSNEQMEINKLILLSNHQVSLRPNWKQKILSPTKITMVKDYYINYKYNNMYQDNLVPTRTFGHKKLKFKNLMNPYPDITTFTLEENNTYEFIIVSDGITDMAINIDEIYQKLITDNEAKSIVEFANNRWKQKWDYYINNELKQKEIQINGIDDVTAIYCKLNC